MLQTLHLIRSGWSGSKTPGKAAGCSGIGCGLALGTNRAGVVNPRGLVGDQGLELDIGQGQEVLYGHGSGAVGV